MTKRKIKKAIAKINEIHATVYYPKHYVCDNEEMKRRILSEMFPRLIKHLAFLKVEQCDGTVLGVGTIKVLSSEKE